MDILIVEDSKPQLLMLAAFVRKIGHEVYMAGNGVEALEILAEHVEIRLVISDWMMPEMDGEALCKSLRKKQDSSYIYFILLTGNTDDNSVVRGLNTGADDYIKKPVKFDELDARLKAGIRIIELEKKLDDRNKKLSQALSIINKDLESAAKMQEELLIQPTTIQNTAFDWFFKPSKYIGGDMFGYHALDEQHVCFYQLDVAGHGIPSALFSFLLNRLMSNVEEQSSFLKEVTTVKPFYRILSAHEVVTALNDRFQATADSMIYFTIAYAILNTDTGRLRLVQAGHPPVLWLSDGESTIKKVEGCGLPVGMMPDITYEEHSIQLNRGDKLVLYSDGIIESENAEQIQYGDKQFEQVLLAHKNLALQKMVAGVKTSIEKWRGEAQFDDDVTYLIVQWH